MHYNEALEYIHSTLKFGSKLGLQNIKSLLELMGNPHKKLKYVHVAGTNGKGSTVTFISSILEQAGYKVGIYTSPYLERFTERIKINNTEIGVEELAKITEFVKSKIDVMLERGENHPTEFEIVTAIAFQYYNEKKCDVVVLEVGLGGRFDSTNIIETPSVAIITTISYDHMDRLGNTLSEIAFEKAGIIKEGGDVIVYPQDKDVEEVFSRVCIDRNAKIYMTDFSKLTTAAFDIDGQMFDYKNYKSLKIGLLGEHQTKNAAVAIEAAEMLALKGFENINEESIRSGLCAAKWPGRMEVLNADPLFIIDGAHNAQGAQVLADNLSKYFPDRRKTFIIGVLRDKDYKTIVEAVVTKADKVIAVTPKSDRALPAEELAIFLEAYTKNVRVADSIEEAVKVSNEEASGNNLICAYGSLYYIGEIRKIFGK